MYKLLSKTICDTDENLFLRLYKIIALEKLFGDNDNVLYDAITKPFMKPAFISDIHVPRLFDQSSAVAANPCTHFNTDFNR
jgi:hypothetical protein